MLCVLLLYLSLVGTGQAENSSVQTDIPVEDPLSPTFRDRQPYFPPESRESLTSSPSLAPQPAQPLEKVNPPSPRTNNSPKQDGGGALLLIVFLAIAYYVYRRMFRQAQDKKCYVCRSKFKRGHRKYVWERDGNTVFVCSMCNRCQICELHFGDRGKLQEWQFGNERKVICLPCHNRLAGKVRQEKFDKWYEETTKKPAPSKPARESIPTAMKREVWQRDQGKCVECGSNKNLEFDHIIPVSKGGANTVRNLQLLCEVCNRSKSATIQ